MTNILGINTFHGNAPAAVVVGRQLVVAVDEERFNGSNIGRAFSPSRLANAEEDKECAF